MVQQTLAFDAELVGFEGVHRAIAIRDDLTLVDLHYALQFAFDWDDDHLYSFWLNGAFWATDCEHLHRCTRDPAIRSARARTRLWSSSDSLSATGSPTSLTSACEWRVGLTVKRALAASGRVPSRVLESVGQAPPQYAATSAEAEDLPSGGSWARSCATAS
jgi:hypothetical protein